MTRPPRRLPAALAGLLVLAGVPGCFTPGAAYCVLDDDFSTYTTPEDTTRALDVAALGGRWVAEQGRTVDLYSAEEKEQIDARLVEDAAGPFVDMAGSRGPDAPGGILAADVYVPTGHWRISVTYAGHHLPAPAPDQELQLLVVGAGGHEEAIYVGTQHPWTTYTTAPFHHEQGLTTLRIAFAGSGDQGPLVRAVTLCAADAPPPPTDEPAAPVQVASDVPNPCTTFTPDLYGPAPVEIFEGRAAPAGRYNVTYLGGAARYYKGMPGWSGQHWAHPDDRGFWLLAENGTRLAFLPGPANETGWDSPADVERLGAGANSGFNWTGGVMAVVLVDAPYSDNEGASREPTWRICRQGCEPVTPAITDASPQPVFGGRVMPAGSYDALYSHGGLRFYRGMPGWTAQHWPHADGRGFWVAAGDERVAFLPGVASAYGRSLAEVEAEGAGDAITFTWPGGAMAVVLVDAPYSDNQGGTPTPTWVFCPHMDFPEGAGPGS